MKTRKVRTCRTLHECTICKGFIRDGEKYLDGGYGNRTHVSCEEKKTDGKLQTDN